MAAHRAEAEQRLQQAETRRAAAEATAVEQRKRRLTMMVAAGVVCVVLAAGAGVSTWMAFRAHDAEKSTRDQLVETDKAKGVAEANGEQAKQRYYLVLASFDNILFAIQDKLASRPGTLEIRKLLLTDARASLRKLLAEADLMSNTDQKYGTLDQELVNSYNQLGLIEQTLGNFEEARKEFQTSHELAKRWAQADPASVDNQVLLSAALTLLGDVSLQMKQPQQALDHFKAKFEINQRLADADADAANPRRQRELGLSLGRMGEVSLLLGKTHEAHGYHEQRLKVIQAISDADPTNAALLRDLGVSFELLDNSAGYLKQPQLALDSYAKMGDIMKRLLDLDPLDPNRQRDLAINLTKLGNMHQDAQQLGPAQRCHEQAADMLMKIVAADPQNLKTQLELFVAYDNLGTIEETLLEYAKAVATYRKGRAVIAPLHAKKQLVGQFENALQSVDQQIVSCQRLAKAIADLDFALAQPPGQVPGLLDLRLQALARKADRAGVAATADAYARLAEQSPAYRYRAACAWSLASHLAKDDAVLREEFASKAMALLRKTPTGAGQATAMAARIMQDADLAPLRERADFKAFVTALTAKE